MAINANYYLDSGNHNGNDGVSGSNIYKVGSDNKNGDELARGNGNNSSDKKCDNVDKERNDNDDRKDDDNDNRDDDKDNRDNDNVNR